MSSEYGVSYYWYLPITPLITYLVGCLFSVNWKCLANCTQCSAIRNLNTRGKQRIIKVMNSPSVQL